MRAATAYETLRQKWQDACNEVNDLTVKVAQLEARLAALEAQNANLQKRLGRGLTPEEMAVEPYIHASTRDTSQEGR